MDLVHDGQVGRECGLKPRGRELVQRQGQADPGFRLRAGGAGDQVTVRPYGSIGRLAEQQAVRRAEREGPVGAQLAVSPRFQVAQVQQAASRARERARAYSPVVLVSRVTVATSGGG